MSPQHLDTEERDRTLAMLAQIYKWEATADLPDWYLMHQGPHDCGDPTCRCFCPGCVATRPIDTSPEADDVSWPAPSPENIVDACPLPREGKCRVCGERMILVEPGQTTHPNCDLGPEL
jgi:hypothetical protein